MSHHLQRLIAAPLVGRRKPHLFMHERQWVCAMAGTATGFGNDWREAHDEWQGMRSRAAIKRRPLMAHLGTFYVEHRNV